ncbi:hypothetical protein BH11PLA2_BH11PLA2_33750 [soil metagenome]
MAKRQPTLTDYAVVAISPALIMLMVGSLVFFLIEVLYQGKYPDRLLWTMFFFVFGSVLISRILIEYGAQRALVYAAGLAGATFVALQAFVDYPNLTMRSFSLLINAGLMALIWWAANKLTWDCTHIDEERRSSGRGVLAAAGLDANATPMEEEPEPVPVTKKPRKESPGMLGWIERWQAHRQKENLKPHTPGVWVLYFSLAALPLFGLGQSLIPPEATDRRRVAFQQMAVYVASGLGLLVTTTLLGLRKYLRDRGASMPNKMTAGWLGVGAVLIVTFIVIGAFLPRPHSETPLINLPKLKDTSDKPEKDASKNAVVKDGSTGQGDGSKGKTENDPNAKQSSDQGKGNGDSKDGEGQAKGENGDKKGEGGEKNDNTKSGDSESKSEKKAEGGKGSTKSEQEQTKKQSSQDGTPSKSSSTMSKVAETASNVMKWLMWILGVLLVIAAIVFFLLRGLAPFTKWAQGLLDWFRNLFARKSSDGATADSDAKAESKVKRPPPFSSFSNPFQDGSHRGQSVEELVAYTFAAFDSWAWDRNLGREGPETPLEFANRVTKAKPNLEAAPAMAKLFTQTQYAALELPANAVSVLKQTWNEMQ